MSNLEETLGNIALFFVALLMFALFLGFLLPLMLCLSSDVWHYAMVEMQRNGWIEEARDE